MQVDLSIEEVAAICDALKWNVAKQRWLSLAWRDEVSRQGHRLRQEQAEEALKKMEGILWRAKGVIRDAL